MSTTLCGLGELLRDKSFGATGTLAFILHDSMLCRKAYTKLHNGVRIRACSSTYLPIEHFRSILRDIEKDANSNMVFFRVSVIRLAL